MAESKVGEARFSLIIHGESLPMEDIEARLGLRATRVIHKGEVLNRLPLIEAPADTCRITGAFSIFAPSVMPWIISMLFTLKAPTA